MKTIEYKGYIGSVEINEEDGTLYGKVLGMDKGTLITYEGDTMVELKADFEEGINDYIAHCQKHNLPLCRSI